ncbi:MAG: YcxB family protein [Lachnospiraceae bacterium]
MELEFDVKMDSKILYDYLLHYNYSTFSGIFGSIIGALFIVGFFLGNGAIFLIVGVVILGYIPWTLFIRSKQQIISNPVFKTAIHYKVTEQGIEVSQEGMQEVLEWSYITKVASTRKSIFLFSGLKNATIIPRSALKDREVIFLEAICKNVEPNRVKIRS